MNKKHSLEHTSWVFVEYDKQNSEDDEVTRDTSRVQEVIASEQHADSDTDSISVISESGCSYRTDEEEFSPAVATLETENSDGNSAKADEEPELIEPKLPEVGEENKRIEKLLYFATSAVCAIVLIGLSVVIHQYLQAASDVNTFDPDQDFTYPHVKNVKMENVHIKGPKKYTFKRKSHLSVGESEERIVNSQKDEAHRRIIISSVQDNDPKRERDVKSNYKLNKNKSSQCNKENCDAKNHKREKIRRDDRIEEPPEDDARANDETYDKKIKQLKVKEDYLRQKEKFLIEKEHDLMKKEIKFNKEKEHYEKNIKLDKDSQYRKKKVDKKHCFQKGVDSFEGKSKEKQGKLQPKEHLKENSINTRNNRKKKYKEETREREHSAQKRYKNFDENDKRKNMSGQWYINLHEGRDHLRQRRRAALKEKKAHWYFQWMVNRARLRTK